MDKAPKIVRICGALLNAYFPRLIADLNCQDEIILKMLSLEDKPNHLAEMVIDMDANRLRSVFPSVSTMDAVHTCFQEMSLDDLYFYAQGSYQMKYCASYANDALRLNNNGIVFQCHDETAELHFEPYGMEVDEPLLLRAKLPSRHSENKIYTIYILLDYSKSGIERILEHFCNCIAGKRTVGCCSHILTIIWYATLGCTSNIRVPAANLANFARRIILEPDFDSE